MAASYTSPVLVQEPVAAPLPASEVASPDTAFDGRRGSVNAFTAPKMEEDDGEHWETSSLVEEILDEVDAFEYFGELADSCLWGFELWENVD
jgi:NAD-dependent histone deacetylase SIR2